MGRSKKDSDTYPMRPPSTTVEGRENQLIAMAYDLAEEQMAKKTASSQTINHFLKMGSPKARLEMEALKNQNELLKAKTEDIKSAKRIEELYKHALEAMRSYRGEFFPDEAKEKEER